MRFNPFGPQKETRECASKIYEVLQGREISKVCGYNYMIDYAEWKKRFDALLIS
ncbi:MAG: hypothetical protein HYV59_03315 [Planctomycetes bacterium]|nr:hypothetical protein [Planctomycetota bacterium]